MSFAPPLFLRAFGSRQGTLGRLGAAMMAHLNRGMHARAIELLEVRPGDSALEIGFGPGIGIQLLARAASAGRVAGVDPSEAMVARAARRNAAAVRVGRVELRCAPAEKLPYEDASFDAALSIDSMPAAPDPAGGVHEVLRVLKPGGRLALGFTRRSSQDKKSAAKMLALAGFRHVRIVDIGSDFCVIAVKARADH